MPMYFSASPELTVGVPRRYRDAIHSGESPLSSGTRITQSSGTPSALAACDRLAINAVARPAPLNARKPRRLRPERCVAVEQQHASSVQQVVIGHHP
jgi:hypothetical protein